MVGRVALKGGRGDERGGGGGCGEKKTVKCDELEK